MGRHSRKGPASQGSQDGTAAGGPQQVPADPSGPAPGTGPGGGRRGRSGPGTDEHTGAGDGTSAHGVPLARGGHPEQRESGGGWGSPQRYGDWQGTSRTAAPLRRAASPAPGGQLIPGPRSEFIDAFDAFDAFDAPRSRPAARRAVPDPFVSADERRSALRDSGAGAGLGGADAQEPDKEPKNSKGRALAGIAAAAVITVLVVVVVGQLAGGADDPSGGTAAAEHERRAGTGVTPRSDGRQAPPVPPPAAAPPPATYDQLMARQFPLAPTLTAAGTFTGVPGFAKAPGKGQKFRYRVDVEKGLGLDGTLFADAVQRTLNDDRSWAHDGDMTFERIAGGDPDFVITLASPGTTGVWCAKSGLDTTVDNVSCDSASTDRVMINAYRWAQGSVTYGPRAMFSYRQMLINHEVGHRLGHNHVNCDTPGTPAPVMQQQTKSLDIDGVACLPNPWVYPED